MVQHVQGPNGRGQRQRRKDHADRICCLDDHEVKLRRVSVCRISLRRDAFVATFARTWVLPCKANVKTPVASAKTAHRNFAPCKAGCSILPEGAALFPAYRTTTTECEGSPTFWRT